MFYAYQRRIDMQARCQADVHGIAARCAVGLAGTADARLCGMIYVAGRVPEVRRIRLETVIAAPAMDCFDLSLSVEAHTDSMEGSGERAIAGVTSGAMKLGDTVTWRARHFGITFRMTSAITANQRPIRFVDEQQRGPFRRWWHEHTFRPAPDGKALMVDVVVFRSPLGWLATFVDRLVLARYMTHLLRQRNVWLRKPSTHLARRTAGLAHGRGQRTYRRTARAAAPTQSRRSVAPRAARNPESLSIGPHTDAASAPRVLGQI